MKKILISLITALSLWGMEGDQIKLSLDLVSGIEAYQYEEKSVMSISGPMYRLDSNLSLLVNLFRIQLEGYYARDINQNIYKGAIFVFNNAKSEKIPYSTQSKDWYAGGNLKLGVSFLPKQIEAHSFAYMGIGYRFLRNNVIDKPGIQASYQRDQSYLYLPFGIDAEVPITDYFSLSAMMEYRFFLQGVNKSGFSRLGYANDLVFKQKKGYGGRFAIVGKFQLYERFQAHIGFYYDYWSVEDSDQQLLRKEGLPTLTFIEPKNTTKALGFIAGLVF